MPTYVYECSKCETTFEVEQRMTEDPLKTCECGGPVKRVIQPVGVMFKGSGFYVNDSKPASSTVSAEPTASDCTGESASCPSCAPAATETASSN